jgi:N-acetylneuraminic acid mutarotase
MFKNLFKWMGLILASVYLISCSCEEAEITSFVFKDLNPVVTGTINQASATIMAEVPNGTDVTALSPTIKVKDTKCHTLDPASETPQDFTNPVTYQVSNSEGGSKLYEVTVNVAEPTVDLEINWEEHTSLPVDLGWMPAVELDGKMYIVGGATDGGTAVNDMYVYDPTTDSWDATKAGIDGARFAHSAEAVNGKIYVMGGVPAMSADALNDIQVYDPLTDEWTVEGNLPERRAGLATCVLDNKIYIAGGITAFPNGNLPDGFYSYDPGSKSWTELSPLPSVRAMVSMEVVDGKIYLVGGTGGGLANGTAFADVYDPDSDSWSSLPDLPANRWGTASGGIGSMLFCMAGITDFFSPGSATSFIYDTEAGSWIYGTPVPLKRLVAAACVYQDQIYLFGGATTGEPFNTYTDNVVVGTPELP